MLNVEPWVEAILWASAIIVAVFGFLANYASVVDWFKRLSESKSVRPKLAIKATFTSSYRDKREDGVEPDLPFINDNYYEREYSLYKLKYELYELLVQQERDYKLSWTYSLTITNNSEYPAYHLKLSCTESDNIDPIDYITPVPPYQSIMHSVTIDSNFYGTQGAAASALYKGTEFQILLEYRDNKDKLYFTIFDSNSPIESQNRYIKAK